MIQSLDLKADTGDTIRLRLQTAAAPGLADALRKLGCVERAETLPAPEEGSAAFSLACRRTDAQGRATDQLFRLLAGMNVPIRMLREERDTLEEIFLRETE